VGVRIDKVHRNLLRSLPNDRWLLGSTVRM
jgi:hypothetical protein